jgi:hypothetical protein
MTGKQQVTYLNQRHKEIEYPREERNLRERRDEM